MKDEASPAAVALQMINAAIQVWKGTFKVKVTCLLGLIPCRSFLTSLLCFCLCTWKIKPSSESWSCNEVEVNDQFCFIKTMSVADPGNVGHCFEAKLHASFQGDWPQQSQCECVATFDLLCTLLAKQLLCSRVNQGGISEVRAPAAQQSNLMSTATNLLQLGSMGHITFKCR